jgi:uncharacterized protein YodC (DUF2158 family)
MSSKQFKHLPAYAIGFSVRLKDGTNSDMLVDDVMPVLNQYRYRCTWVDAQGVVQFADFREDELERVPTTPSAETKPIPAAAVIRRPHNPL